MRNKRLTLTEIEQNDRLENITDTLEFCQAENDRNSLIWREVSKLLKPSYVEKLRYRQDSAINKLEETQNAQDNKYRLYCIV